MRLNNFDFMITLPSTDDTTHLSRDNARANGHF